MIDGAGGNIGNWDEVKAQARTMLGIDLVDADVFNVPLLVDRPLRSPHSQRPTGFPLVVLAARRDGRRWNPAAPVASSLLARRPTTQFLNDIAHNARSRRRG